MNNNLNSTPIPHKYFFFLREERNRGGSSTSKGRGIHENMIVLGGEERQNYLKKKGGNG